MNILLLVATDEEFEATKKLYPFIEKRFDDLTYYLYSNKNNNLIFLKGGVGKSNMAYRIGKISALYSLSEKNLIINTGLAASLNPDCSVYDIVIADKCAYYDVDVTLIDHTQIGKLPDLPLFFESEKELINKYAKELNFKVGHIVSGDRFIANENLPENLELNFDKPLAIDMESACVAHIAYLMKVPSLIIRAISDIAIESIKTNTYEIDISKKCQELVLKVKNIIDEYLSK